VQIEIYLNKLLMFYNGMKKRFFVILLITILLVIGCIQEQTKPEITEDVSGITKDFIGCENPADDEIKVCDLITDNTQLQQCKETSNIEWAFFCVAFSTKNSEACENIKENSYKYICKAYAEDNPLICDEINKETERDKCYLDLGMNFQNKELCDKIKDESKKAICLGVINLDLEKCFEYEEYKEICIQNIIEFSQGKISCDSLDEERREECSAILGE